MTELDPLAQAAAVLQSSSTELIAEAARHEAECILLTAITNDTEVQAVLLSRVSQKGAQYLSAVTVAVCLHARRWARLLAGRHLSNVGEYMVDTDPEVELEEWDRLAHDALRRLMNAESVTELRPVGAEVQLFIRTAQQEEVGKYVTHLASLAGELVTTVMEIKRDEARQMIAGDTPEG